ncbi:MAG: formylglycine-generating enzyme family protein, partial [Pyrinomonadaceae bacterium]
PPPVGPGPTPPALPESLRKIDGGTFLMGLNEVSTTDPYDLNQYPARSVSVTTFLMDKTEVTNAEYADFVKADGHTPPSNWSNGKPPSGQEQWPVTNVSLADANTFAAWRSKRDSKTYRLPTEEEWEYAGRNGPQGTRYPWGNEWVNGYANLDATSLKSVGSYPKGASSRWGVLDLIGNVWEWTSSNAALYPGNDKMDKPSPELFVIRGGGYSDPSSGPRAVTATRRYFLLSTDKDNIVGFRLVRAEP